jgi:hypothetical protein
MITVSNNTLRSITISYYKFIQKKRILHTQRQRKHDERRRPTK